MNYDRLGTRLNEVKCVRDKQSMIFNIRKCVRLVATNMEFNGLLQPLPLSCDVFLVDQIRFGKMYRSNFTSSWSQRFSILGFRRQQPGKIDLDLSNLHTIQFRTRFAIQLQMNLIVQATHFGPRIH